MKTFAHKGCKIAAQKKNLQILPCYQDFCGIGATIRIGREILCLPYAGFFFSPECDEYLFLTEYEYRILFSFKKSPNTEY